MFRLARIVLLAAFSCWSLTVLHAADPVSPRNANGSITKAIPQPDGKVIVVGFFSYIGSVERAGIARLKADGTLDPTFDPGSGANGEIKLLALQADGKVLITGSFTAVAGTPRAGIARLNANGTLDLGFDAGTGPNNGAPTAEIMDLQVDGSDKAVLAGRFDIFSGVTRHLLVRLNLDGSVDPTFDAGKNLSNVGGGPGGYAERFAFYPDGRLVVIGYFQAASTYDIARLAVDGTVDQSFLPKGVSNAAVVAQPDGRIIIGDGYVNGSTRGIVRLNADGQTDITFNAAAHFPTVIRLQQDGSILVLDSFGLRRLNYNGTDDPAFVQPQLSSGNSASALLRGVEAQVDGKILIFGSFNKVNGVPRVGLARLLANGAVDPTFVPDQSSIATGFVLNLSTRVAVGTGDHVLIGGFIVDGAAAKKLMIRGIGPSLASSNPGVPTPLADPRVSLRTTSGAVLAQNDNWRTTQIGGAITSDQANEIQASGIAPKSDAESAMIVILAPGAYTAIIEGAGGGTALVEMYDLDGNTATRVANISTRGDVATGDNVLICGAILGGTHPTEVLVRALGPSLTASGVTGALQDPTLTLHNANGFLVGSNENWKDYQQHEIEATEAAPPDDREAAILSVLQPGNYTAVVRGRNNTTGIALVDFYSL
jgi:uncharacterized delta-60 repeat protein